MNRSDVGFVLWLILVGVLAVALFAIGIPAMIAENEAAENRLLNIERRLSELEERQPQGGVEICIEDIRLPIHSEDFVDLSSAFGPRRSPFTGEMAHHPGLDLYGVWHARVISIGSGVVMEHWIPPGQRRGFRGHPELGGLLVVQLDDGTVMRYGHLSETYVREGDRVQDGQVIGRQGSTGRSTGEHLHFEVIEEGKNVNPLVFLSGLTVGAVAASQPMPSEVALPAGRRDSASE